MRPSRHGMKIGRALPACIIAAGWCGAASAGIAGVGADYFGAGTTVITFEELALDTPLPFTIGIADFSGSGGLITTFGEGDPAAPPAPSGGQFLYTGSDGMDDWIEVVLGAPQEAVGAYFNLGGGGTESAVVVLEVYSGDTLLGILETSPDENFGGFVGASAGRAIIDRVIFRDIDDSLPVSFRIDDFQFVPAPGGMLVIGLAALRRRRRL